MILSESKNVHWYVTPDHESLSHQACAIILDEISRRPGMLLCAAAGSSPRRAYSLLAENLSVSPSSTPPPLMRVVKIDEWGGLGLNDPASCEADLRRHLLDPLQIGPDRYAGFRGDASDPKAECKRVSEWLAQNGPIDLCVLGVGTNGHIAMNEPADVLKPHAHVATLAPASLQHKMLKGLPNPPGYGLSLGMADILQSRKILLLASGASKREVLRRFREQLVTTSLPVSFLWLHPDVTVLCDEVAFGAAG